LQEWVGNIFDIECFLEDGRGGAGCGTHFP
jgi:hypothetical protein